jgi:hypothetical protein
MQKSVRFSIFSVFVMNFVVFLKRLSIVADGIAAVLLYRTCKSLNKYSRAATDS